MCRDLKIQSHINKSKAKYEIGHFCTQYGLPSSSLPKGSISTKGRNPLKNPLGKSQPSTIESRGTRPMTSIRKGNLKNPFHKHPANATTVERKVISRVSVEPKPSHLSTLSLVTNPAKMRSSSY